MVSVELAGTNSKGEYRRMGAGIMDNCGVTSELFRYAYKNKICPSIGVGDGGNEVGMGKVYWQVVKHIRNGPQIACDIPCAYLLTCGVSNWGAEALGVALHSSANDLGLVEPTLPSLEFHELMYKKASEYGALDGINHKGDGWVDGFEYSEHREMFRKMIEVASYGGEDLARSKL